MLAVVVLLVVVVLMVVVVLTVMVLLVVVAVDVVWLVVVDCGHARPRAEQHQAFLWATQRSHLGHPSSQSNGKCHLVVVVIVVVIGIVVVVVGMLVAFAAAHATLSKLH